MTYTESIKSGHIAVWSPDTFKIKPEELNSTFDVIEITPCEVCAGLN